MPLNDTRAIKAKQAKEGMWLAFSNPRFNQRIVEIGGTRDGQIKMHTDYGNGGEPGTSFFDPDETILINK